MTTARAAAVVVGGVTLGALASDWFAPMLEAGPGVGAAQWQDAVPVTALWGDSVDPSQLESSWQRRGREVAPPRCGALAERMAEIADARGARAPVEWRCGCSESGLGDRLKGVVAAWMLALVLGRPFLVESDRSFAAMAAAEFGAEPAVPELADWRTGYGAYVANATLRRGLMRSNRASDVLDNPGRYPVHDLTRPIEIKQTTPAKVALLRRFVTEVLNGDADVLSSEAYVGDGKNWTHDDAPLISDAFRRVVAHAHHCATRTLLRPSPGLRTLLNAELAQLPLQGRRPYFVGLHVRFGGRWKDFVRANDKEAHLVMACAWNATQHRRGRDTRPVWLAISDDPDRLARLVREFRNEPAISAAWREQAVIVQTSDVGQVAHTAARKAANSSSFDAIKRLWLDWFKIGEAHTCALIRSSFPRTACYASQHRDDDDGLIHQFVTRRDNRYARHSPACERAAQ